VVIHVVMATRLHMLHVTHMAHVFHMIHAPAHLHLVLVVHPIEGEAPEHYLLTYLEIC